jgi:hypothetical protein
MQARLLLLVGLASLVLATPAAAGPVTIAPAAYSEEFQEKLTDNYGVREGDYLRDMIDRSLRRELARVGGGPGPGSPVTIETTIVDARPNRPTFQQLGDRPGLDFGRSIGVGGAELVAVLRGPEGGVIGEVHHRFFETNIENVVALSTWGDARRSIDRFARKVAAEYARTAPR